MILMMLAGTQLYAHDAGESYVFVKVYDHSLDGRFEISFQDLNKAMGYDNPDSMINKNNLDQHLEDIYAFYRQRVQFSNDGTPYTFAFSGYDIMEIRVSDYVMLPFNILENVPKIPEKFKVDYNVLFDIVPEHKAFLVIEHHWKNQVYNNEAVATLVFTDNKRSDILDLGNPSLFKGFMGVLNLGMTHIWEGIDHVLFIIALILPAVMYREEKQWLPVNEFKPAFIYLVKVISFFTIAHSITISLAATGIVDLPGSVVEPLIAASIIVAAIDIIYPIFKGRIGWVVFGFGLFHGFGFAGLLTSRGVLGEHLMVSLLGFNLGVEIGQLVIILVAFPIIYLVRKYAFYPNLVMRVGAAALIFVAAIWFVERTFDVEIPVTNLFSGIF